MRPQRLRRVVLPISRWRRVWLVVAVVAAALLSGWKYGPYLDPIVSMLVVVAVACSGGRLLRDSSRVLLEGTPEGLDLEELRRDVRQLVPGADLHHIHVWELRPGHRLLTAHLRLADDGLLSRLESVLEQVRNRLATRWAISHSTLEPEIVGCGENHLLGVPSTAEKQKKETTL